MVVLVLLEVVAVVFVVVVAPPPAALASAFRKLAASCLKKNKILLVYRLRGVHKYTVTVNIYRQPSDKGLKKTNL